MPTLIEQIRPKPDERMLIVGQTGSGKTTLARELLRGYARVLVIDPKCTYEPRDDRYKLVRSVSSLRSHDRDTHLHFRPGPREQSVEAYDAVYRWAYEHPPLLVYTDETYRTMRRSYSPEWQQAIVTCGREIGIGAIFATQRPRGIDTRIYSEAEHQICFYLKNLADRDRMSEEMGDIVLLDPIEAARLAQIKAREEGRISQVREMPWAFWRWSARSRKTLLSQLTVEL